MTIYLIDTSVLCNLLHIPNMDQHSADVIRDLNDLVELNVLLILPLATILETGNHIAKVEPASRRRWLAQKFLELLQNKQPWDVDVLFNVEDLEAHLTDFPDYAMKKVGIGDLIILKEYEKQCLIHPYREVRIWTYDNDFKQFGCRCHP